MLSCLAFAFPAFCDTRGLFLTLAQFLSLSCHGEPSVSLQLGLSAFLLASHGALIQRLWSLVLPRIIVFLFFSSFRKLFFVFSNNERPRAARSPSSRVEWKRLKHCHKDRLPLWSREDTKSSMPDGVICIRSKIACFLT